MSLTSLNYLFFILFAIVVFYLIKEQYQWMVLLGASIYFFAVSSKPFTGLYVLFSIIVTYICGIQINKYRERKLISKIALSVGIIANLCLIFILKYNGFFISNYNTMFNKSVDIWKLAAPLGISFYTFQLIAYLLDVYWETTNCEDNILKFALYTSYFPLLTSGPIVRHNDLKGQLYGQHKFSLDTILRGLLRIFWGIFKKIVISARIALLVNGIYSNTANYSGVYIWIAVFIYMLQLYTDFSGCMDIIIGSSECFGIIIPENFRTPFFSRSVQEFWQRWHISLGTWAKDYIMTPVYRSKTVSQIGKGLRNTIGRKNANRIVAYFSMFVVWLFVGFWHGGAWKYVLGQGMWFFMWIVFEQLFTPSLDKVWQRLRINKEWIIWRLIQSIRVYVTVSLGNMFFRLSSIREVKETLFRGCDFSANNSISMNTIYGLGLKNIDCLIIIIGIVLVAIIGVVQERVGSVRTLISNSVGIVRWGIWIGLIFSIIVLGVYGPGVDSSEFIYQMF